MVTIDPFPLHEIDIIENHKFVDSMDELKITNIRKKIGLDDSDFHETLVWQVGDNDQRNP